MPALTTAFPDDIARGAVGGHGYFSTNVVVTIGGTATTNQLWENARGEWNVSQGIKQTDGYETARSHFYMARGAARQFLFKDWADYRCARADGRMVQITTTTFQIAKVYGAEVAHEYVRPLRRPDTGSVQVWRNAAPLTLGVGFTVDVDTGIVTLASPIGGDTVEVACSFKVLARYRIDAHAARLLFRRSETQNVVEWDGIEVVEERDGQ